MPLLDRPYPSFPRRTAPVVVIGAGGIVNDAHLPAYRLAGIEVFGIYDLDAKKARTTAERFQIQRCFASLDEAIDTAPNGAVFDLAVPAAALSSVLARLPLGAPVLLQKPMGNNLNDARAIREICRRRQLKSAVNFQLRFAPCIAAAREVIRSGAIGELHDLEVRVSVYTPWHLWSFLEHQPRVEVLYHSIHYVDLIRSFLGDPLSVRGKTWKHPSTPSLAATRSQFILDYGESLRACISTNHGHRYGRSHQESFVQWEGTRGALRAKLGVLLDYPKGEPDALELCQLNERGAPGDWKPVPLEGNWFPLGFRDVMGSVMAFAAGEADWLPTDTEDAFRTMAVVEAAYDASAAEGMKVEYS